MEYYTLFYYHHQHKHQPNTITQHLLLPLIRLPLNRICRRVCMHVCLCRCVFLMCVWFLSKIIIWSWEIMFFSCCVLYFSFKSCCVVSSSCCCWFVAQKLLKVVFNVLKSSVGYFFFLSIWLLRYHKNGIFQMFFTIST